MGHNMQEDYMDYKELFDFFECYTVPKLIKVLEENGIPYRTYGRGKVKAKRNHVHPEKAK